MIDSGSNCLATVENSFSALSHIFLLYYRLVRTSRLPSLPVSPLLSLMLRSTDYSDCGTMLLPPWTLIPLPSDMPARPSSSPPSLMFPVPTTKASSRTLLTSFKRSPRELSLNPRSSKERTGPWMPVSTNSPWVLRYVIFLTNFLSWSMIDSFEFLTNTFFSLSG